MTILLNIQTGIPLRVKGGTSNNFVRTKGANLDCPGQIMTYGCLAQ